MKSIPKNLIAKFFDASKVMDLWLLTHYPKGKQLVWKFGKYAGRKAELRYAFWRLEPSGACIIWVRVKTLKLSGVGTIDGNDSIHRRYYVVEHSFDVVDS